MPTFLRGMRDLVLPPDDGAIDQLRSQRDAALRPDHRQHQAALRDAGHPAEQEDGRLERPEEQPGTGEEEVSCDR